MPSTYPTRKFKGKLYIFINFKVYFLVYLEKGESKNLVLFLNFVLFQDFDNNFS